MNTHEILSQITALSSKIDQLSRKLENAAMPPNQILLDDVELRELLKVSKRTTATWREKKMIIYSQPCGKIFYKLSDVLAFLAKYEVSDITSNFK
jgi:hypothetical protein